MRRLRVLISAYACEPDLGSEPGVGWNWVLQLARFHDLWVITREANRTAIEGALRTTALPSVQWVYMDLPRGLRFWKRGRRGVHAYYMLWQLWAFQIGRRLHASVRFDLVHHVTFVNYWMPSFLVFLPAPFVWGPVGGGESVPPGFARVLGPRGWVSERVRDIARWLSEQTPILRRVARRARIVLATTPETAQRLRRLGAPWLALFPDSGLAPEDVQRLERIPPRSGTTVRFLSVGRMLHWKGFRLSVQAFARFHRTRTSAEYWIVGEGPERPHLERLVQRLGVAGSVRFLGRLTRDATMGVLADCDILVHPSLHDSGGWVCLEAMAAGRPLICLDRGGPGVMVTNETGVKVPALTPAQTVEDLAAAMARLAGDPALRQAMGEAGRRRVREHFLWDRKAAVLLRLYAGAVGA